MSAETGLWAVLGTLLALLSVPGTVELLLLTVGGMLRPSPPASLKSQAGMRLAIVVPAHNEGEHIAACIQSLHACDPGDGTLTVVVVADNCEDDTASRAEIAGARVLERHDPDRRGKGYALDFAFRQLLAEPFDAFMVVDADTRVGSNLLAEAQRLFQNGADAVQCRYCVDKPDASLRTRLMNVALWAFNVLRPRGREFWGLSVGLLGNGFGLSRATLEAVPYDAASVAEDLEYHIRLVQTGRRVRFLDAATVWSEMPSGGRVAGGQRARWEGGRFRMIREQTPILLRGMLAGRWREAEPLLELWLLPLAFHVLLLALALLPPFAPARIYALCGLTLVGVHVLAAIRVGGGGWRDLGAVTAAPFYILWKLTLFKALWRSSRKDAAWVHTDREATPSPAAVMAVDSPDVSVVIVSFNTRDLLRECLLSLADQASGVRYETIVVDNASRDGSADMIAAEFPEVRLIRSPVNLGFAAANNRGFAIAQGRYIVLLNSDAFLRPGALPRAVAYMDSDPKIGLGGARLIGRDDSWQPSARLFPSPLNDLLALSGLAAKFPHSRFLGRVDRTWADPGEPAAVDWVPGAFSITRRSVLQQVGDFDEAFFLYYEEVDLCRRIKAAGYTVNYWPEVVVVHLGGESSKTIADLTLSSSGAQLTLWRLRSEYLYYRKQHGLFTAWRAMQIEKRWHQIRAGKNAVHRADPTRRAKAEESRAIVALIEQAWYETSGGRVSPPRPW